MDVLLWSRFTNKVINLYNLLAFLSMIGISLHPPLRNWNTLILLKVDLLSFPWWERCSWWLSPLGNGSWLDAVARSTKWWGRRGRRAFVLRDVGARARAWWIWTWIKFFASSCFPTFLSWFTLRCVHVLQPFFLLSHLQKIYLKLNLLRLIVVCKVLIIAAV